VGRLRVRPELRDLAIELALGHLVTRSLVRAPAAEPTPEPPLAPTDVTDVNDVAGGPDHDPFESARYMPVTRDLSANRRQLLRRYCAKVLAEPLPPGPPERVVAAPTQEGVVASFDGPGSDVDGSFPKTGRG